jgi:hypothetical protein
VRLTLTDIDAPWFRGNDDNDGDYDVLWNGVKVGSVERVPSGFVTRSADGLTFLDRQSRHSPIDCAVAACDRYAEEHP